MTDTVTGDRDAFVLMLRSKTAFGRLNDSEVHAVLAFLETIGFVRQVAPAAVALIEPAPGVPLTPADQVAAQVAQVLPVAPPPVSTLASLEAAIENDVKAFLAPPPAQ